MTPADLVIRDADLPAVRALLVETWHATYDGIYGWQRVAEITNAWHSLENLGAQLGRENGAFLVALVGSEIVAPASARTERDRAALLTRLYVLPAWQGVGIGRTLLDAVLQWCKDQGVTRAQILVDIENTPAVGYYQHLGWQPTQLQARRMFI